MKIFDGTSLNWNDVGFIAFVLFIVGLLLGATYSYNNAYNLGVHDGIDIAQKAQSKNKTCTELERMEIERIAYIEGLNYCDKISNPHDMVPFDWCNVTIEVLEDGV